MLQKFYHNFPVLHIEKATACADALIFCLIVQDLLDHFYLIWS